MRKPKQTNFTELIQYILQDTSKLSHMSVQNGRLTFPT